MRKILVADYGLLSLARNPNIFPLKTAFLHQRGKSGWLCVCYGDGVLGRKCTKEMHQRGMLDLLLRHAIAWFSESNSAYSSLSLAGVLLSINADDEVELPVVDLRLAGFMVVILCQM